MAGVRVRSDPAIRGVAVMADLERFVGAQDGVCEAALAELRRGRKTGHWMWFIFPQSAGLGRSEMSRRYAIGSLEEARAYLDHPVLGPRLLACAEAVLTGPGTSADAVFGEIDSIKLRSSMTLFQIAAPDVAVFGGVLERYFGGRPDPATEALLA